MQALPRVPSSPVLRCFTGQGTVVNPQEDTLCTNSEAAISEEVNALTKDPTKLVTNNGADVTKN